jgi:hypothetical protein
MDNNKKFYGFIFNMNQFREYFSEFLVLGHMGLELIDLDFEYNSSNLNKLLGINNNQIKWYLKVDTKNNYYMGINEDDNNNNMSRNDFIKIISENSRLKKINIEPIEVIL